MTINTPKNPVQDTFLLGTIYKDRPSVGIIIEDANCSQIVFEAFQSTYTFFNDVTSKVEILFFQQNIEPFAVRPPSGVYTLDYLLGYRGHIITTSVFGLFSALKIPTLKSITWYIYDINEPVMYNKDIIKSLLVRKDIKKVCRSFHYKRILTDLFEEDIKIDHIVPDFNMSEMVNVSLGKNHGLYK